MCSDFEPPSAKTSEKGNAEHGVAALLESWVHLLNYISPFYCKYKTWEYSKTFFCQVMCHPLWCCIHLTFYEDFKSLF